MKTTQGRVAVLTVLLVAAWLLWSGLFKPLLLGLGLLSVVLTLVLARRMGYFDRELFALQFSTRLFVYWGWLLVQIVRSSMEVARIVLDPKLRIQPQVFRLRSKSQSQTGQAIFANSITLTPGSLALNIEDGHVDVHTLTLEGAEELLEGEMNRRVERLGKV